MSSVAPVAAAAAEAQQLLRELIRVNTVNPPGNERPASEYLAQHLREAGFECELLGAEPTRPNLLARLRADGARGQQGPTLCYLGHLDTVLADPAEWTHDPWAGDLAEGFIWGRGAVPARTRRIRRRQSRTCGQPTRAWRSCSSRCSESRSPPPASAPRRR